MSIFNLVFFCNVKVAVFGYVYIFWLQFFKNFLNGYHPNGHLTSCFGGNEGEAKVERVWTSFSYWVCEPKNDRNSKIISVIERIMRASTLIPTIVLRLQKFHEPNHSISFWKNAHFPFSPQYWSCLGLSELYLQLIYVHLEILSKQPECHTCSYFYTVYSLKVSPWLVETHWASRPGC